MYFKFYKDRFDQYKNKFFFIYWNFIFKLYITYPHFEHLRSYSVFIKMK